MTTGPTTGVRQTSPERYRHWRLDLSESAETGVAYLRLDIAEDGGLVPGYELQDELLRPRCGHRLYDATQRLRFEQPRGARGRGDQREGPQLLRRREHSHARAVQPPLEGDFCKFTNETRNGMEDATANSGQTYLAAVNGTAAGGGYELALACERICSSTTTPRPSRCPRYRCSAVLPAPGGLTGSPTSASAQGPGGRVRHQARGRARQTRPSSGSWSTRSFRAAVGRGRPERAAPRPPSRAAQPMLRASPCLRWSRCAPRTRSATDTSPPSWTGSRARWRSPWPARRVTSRNRRRGCTSWAPTSGHCDDPRAGRPDPLAAANELELGTWVIRTKGDVEDALAFER